MDVLPLLGGAYIFVIGAFYVYWAVMPPPTLPHAWTGGLVALYLAGLVGGALMANFLFDVDSFNEARLPLAVGAVTGLFASVVVASVMYARSLRQRLAPKKPCPECAEDVRAQQKSAATAAIVSRPLTEFS